MRRYKRFNATPEAVQQLELALKDDGTFVWLVTEGVGSSHSAHGTWKRTGDVIAFEIGDASADAPVPTTAVVQGDRLELAGFGVFA